MSRPFAILPTIVPLGDSALLVRFAERLEAAANARAIGFAAAAEAAGLPGVAEVAPGLVSVLVRYRPQTISFTRLSGELSLLLNGLPEEPESGPETEIAIAYDGPDLEEVSALLSLSRAAFITRHQALTLRVLSTGFAPGFVYLGLHDDALRLPRRTTVRPKVAPGTVLFAAGQTAITSTAIPTGWHVIGTTDFRNFHPDRADPLVLKAGDRVRLRTAP